jgi:hypothetical protein
MTAVHNNEVRNALLILTYGHQALGHKSSQAITQHEPSAQGRNPPANENRPKPQVETATARHHSSHHNDSQTVFWLCQNWQQHQMISPW